MLWVSGAMEAREKSFLPMFWGVAKASMARLER